MLESPDLPSDPKSTNLLDTGDPDLTDSIIDDSLGFTDDNAGLDSDPDEPPVTGELPFDAAAADTALVNPRDPFMIYTRPIKVS